MALPPVFIEFIGSAAGFMAASREVKGELDSIQAKGAESGLLGAAAKGVAVIGAAAIAAGAASIDMATKFQSSMLLIQTQAGASAGEVKQMSGAVLALSGQVATGPQALAGALYNVESAGQRGSVALNTLKIAAEGAKVGHADLNETASALVATLQSGIPGTENAQQAMGALNATVGAGKMTLSDLNDALSTGLLPAVKGFGLNMNDAGAALADFGDQGITGAKAANDLRMAVQAMAKPVVGGAAELKKLGMTSTQLATDMSTGGLNKALLDLQAHMQKAGVGANQIGPVLTDAFGKKAGVGLAVLEGNMGLFEQKVGLVKTGANGFGAAWTATTKTISYQWDEWKANVEAVGIKIGTWLLPLVGKAMAAISEDVGKAVAWVEKHKQGFIDVGEAIEKFALAAYKAFRPELVMVVGIIKDGVKWVEQHKKGLEEFAKVVAGALIIAIKIAVGTFRVYWDVLHAGLIIFGDIWDWAKKLPAAWKDFTDALDHAMDDVQAWFLNLPSNIQKWVADAIHWLEGLGKDVITGMWNGIKSTWRTVTDWAGGIQQDILGYCADAIHWLEGIGKDLLTGLWNGITNQSAWLEGKIKGLGKDITGWAKDALGILSPSKVMADEVGAFIPQGIAKGMLDNAHYVKNATNTLGQITSSAKFGTGATVGLGTLGGGTSGTPVNLYLTVEGSVVSNRDLLDLIKTQYQQLGLRVGIAKTYQPPRR